MAHKAPATVPWKKVEINTGPIMAANKLPKPKMPNHDNIKGGANSMRIRAVAPKVQIPRRLIHKTPLAFMRVRGTKAVRKSCDTALDTECSNEVAVDIIINMMNSVTIAANPGDK